jgi:hypothetical protein
MLSETVVSTFLVASITGAGLVLAIYALITPLSEKIFRERARNLERLLEDFEKEKSKITADSSNKDFKHFNNLKDQINEINIFPRYLSYGISLTFILFMSSVLFDWAWLINTANQVPSNDYYVTLPFGLAIASFLMVGLLAIIDIFGTMRKEFEEIKKKQKAVKELTIDDMKVTDIKDLTSKMAEELKRDAATTGGQI